MDREVGLEESDIKKKKKETLWYNPVKKKNRDIVLEDRGISGMAADREGRALLAAYDRMYRAKW